MSFLSKHNSVKHTYVLDPAYKKKENVHDGVRRMSGKEKSR